MNSSPPEPIYRCIAHCPDCGAHWSFGWTKAELVQFALDHLTSPVRCVLCRGIFQMKTVAQQAMESNHE